MDVIDLDSFEVWRSASRDLLKRRVPPDSVTWVNSRRGETGQTVFEQESLFPHEKSLENSNKIKKPKNKKNIKSISVQSHPKERSQFKVSKRFLDLALYVSCHRDETKWSVLYRCLWRMFNSEPYLLSISSDDDVRLLFKMEKEVSRDRHKMKAFVRFRKVDNESGEEAFIAWHQPSHYVLRLAAPFFVRRFKVMNFAILTPDESIYWDTKTLLVGEGEPRTKAPKNDELEELWLTFYRHIFNPARIKVSMMKSEMPKKYWHTMPETQLIPTMLAEAPERVRKMIRDSVI